MTKELQTLPEDIFKLFDPELDHTIDEDNLSSFLDNLGNTLRRRLAKQPERTGALRMSNIGKKDRQIWYAAHPDGSEEQLRPETYFKFLYGDIIEEIILFLAKEAGHSVEREQEEIEVDGVLGHIDAVVDGVVVDVKSASSFGFKKFQENTVLEDDPFGYVNQLAGYADTLTPGQPAAWIAADKVSGAICVTPLSSSVILDNKAAPRIEHLKKVIDSPEPPSRCYDEVPDGKSGNMKLPVGCSYCQHKFRCWPNVRTFIYSTGPRFLTRVGKVPNVPEVV